VAARHDCWAIGGPYWWVHLELADDPPQPHWPAPEVARGRILGEVADDWGEGREAVDCRLAHSDATFPVRLTTCDAGDEASAGWQWVPRRGNHVAIDTDWALTGLPALRYAERTRPARDPYLSEPPADRHWLARFGARTIRFFSRGVHID
jgi:hypothetical protein